nr:NAD-dependent epimerase/dehydratase family protein [Synergistales bacterium]
IDGDIRDIEKVKEAMIHADMVVHCAAALPLYSEEDIFSTDMEGTRNVISTAHRSGVKRFVHISSTAVYGIPDTHPIYEEHPVAGVGPYGKAKIQAEEVCLEFRNRGMTVPILRPKSFVGPERLGVFAMFYDWAYTGHHFPVLGKGNNPYQLMDVADLCEAVYLCLTLSAERVNDIFNVGAREFTTLKEDFQAVLDKAGHGKRMISIPVKPAIALLKLLEKMGISPLYQWIYDTVSRESFVSIDKAEKELGFDPKYSNKDALIRNYRWYVEHLGDFRGEAGITHKTPWKQGALKIAKFFF